MVSLTWEEVLGARLARAHLLEPAPRTRLEAVVGAVCGLQAQVLAAAEMGLGVRVRGATQETVRHALWTRRSLVKTYGPRGTLHLLPARELGMWMGAMCAVASLDRAAPGEAVQAIGEALRGQVLTREELAAAVGRRLGPAAREQLRDTWGRGLAAAAFTGRLCFGPPRGTKVTFVRADEWVAGWRDVDPGAALRRVFLRYVRSYGPVTARDFSRWMLLPVSRATALVDGVAPQLRSVAVEGQTAWVDRRTPEAQWAAAPGSLCLVPQYDAYALGSYPRAVLVPEAARRRVSGHGRGRYEGAVSLPLLLVGGRVAGMWERRATGKRLVVRVEPFVRLDAHARSRLGEAAEVVARFHQRSLDLQVGRLAGPRRR